MVKEANTKAKKLEAQKKTKAEFSVLVKSMKAFTKKHGGYGFTMIQGWAHAEVNRIRIQGEIDAKKKELKELA